MNLRLFSVFLLGAIPVWGLPIPEDSSACAQLGLSPEATEFSLEELQGDRIVLLMFDLYCPTCQKSAANFNRLIEALATEHAKVTVLGIGCGDTAFETARFVKKFKLDVPAVPDRERSLGHRFSLSKTPSVMLLERGPDGDLVPLYQHSGYFGREEVDALLTALTASES